MKLQNAAALALLTLGAAHLVQKERHQRQLTTAAAVRDRAERLDQVTLHPEFAALWKPEDMTTGEYIECLDADRQIHDLSLRHRLGLLRGHQLRSAAEAIMGREHGKHYWERLDSFHDPETVPLAAAFTDIMNAAYVSAVRRQLQEALQETTA